MVCENATAPLDLDSSQANQCAIQCSLNFNYPTIHTTSISNSDGNDGGKLSVVLQQPDSPCVTFNTAQYIPVELHLFTPGLHTFSGGDPPQAELIIEHIGQVPQPTTTLLICVPIYVSSLDNNEALDSIVEQARTTVPTAGTDSSAGTVSYTHLRAHET